MKNGFDSQMKKISEEVFFGDSPVVCASSEEIAFLKKQAANSPRHRARLCAHQDAQDSLHEMLIVLTNQVYIRPHKHFRKPESFHVVEGAAVIIFFSDEGVINEVIRVGDLNSGKPFYFRNDTPRYHTQIITSDFLVFHETTKGPLNQEDTVFAPWAPEESNATGIKSYLENLLASIPNDR